MSKLKNIKAIGEMLQGDHRTQRRKTFYMGTARGRARASEFKVGECWHEQNPDGLWKTFFKLKGRVEEARGRWDSYQQYQQSRVTDNNEEFDWLEWKYRNCDPNNTSCEKGYTIQSRKIERLIARTGMCFDCLNKYELKLQLEGKFNDYAMDKMRGNLTSYIRDQEIELEAWKTEMRNGVKVLLNGEGQTEKFSSDSTEAMIAKIESEWEEYKKMLYENYGVTQHES